MNPPSGVKGLSRWLTQPSWLGAGVGVVLALTHGRRGGASGTGDAWQQILDDHEGITGRIRTDAAWVRAVADASAANARPMRVVTLVDAAGPGGRSRAQAATQLARAAHGATQARVDAFAISLETADGAGRRTAAEVAAYLVGADGVAALSGAELVVDRAWFGLRSHPSAAGSVAFAGPELPDWLDGAFRKVMGTSA